jgi:hypothetical protein
MPYCYYTCHLLPLDLVARSGYSSRWLGGHLREADAPVRRDALVVHPMTCPFVTKLVAAAEEVLGPTAAPGDCLVVPGGCDAMRRLGDLLAAVYPGRVFTLSMPRTSGDAVADRLAADLRRLEEWLADRLAGVAPAAAVTGGGVAGDPSKAGLPTVDYPTTPRPGGVFVVAGPLSNDSLLDLIHRLGAHVSALESCTSPDRWRPLLTAGAPIAAGAPIGATAPVEAATARKDHRTLAAELLSIGMCPRRSTAERREHLSRRLDETKPSSVVYARQSFCDPGAYDALLVAQLAEERHLPYLEIEVDFPFDANGPLRTRVEAFLEAQLLDDALLGGLDDLDDDLFAEEA